MLAGEAPNGDLALAGNGHSTPPPARLARATRAPRSGGGPPSSSVMLLRRLRWVLAGALVAWTLVRAFGLERGWPLVPLFAFTPYVALFALLVAARGRVAALVGGRRRDRAVRGAAARAAGAAGDPRPRAGRRARGASAGARRQRRGQRRRRGADDRARCGAGTSTSSASSSCPLRSCAPTRPRASTRCSPTRRSSRGPASPAPGSTRGCRCARLPPRAAPTSPSRPPSCAPPRAAPVGLVAVHVVAPTDGAATAQWRRDMRALPSSGAGPPRVLAGDFNATFDHAELRRLLDRGYRDAAEQAGVALRPTWPAGGSLPPAVDDRPRAGRPPHPRRLRPQRRDPRLGPPRRARRAAAASR